MILIISFKTSFEKNKINLFPALTAPFPLIFLLNLFLSFEAKLVTSPGKFSLVKEIATFFSAFLPKLASQEPQDPLDWIVLDIWASYLSFLPVEILLANAFLNLRKF